MRRLLAAIIAGTVTVAAVAVGADAAVPRGDAPPTTIEGEESDGDADAEFDAFNYFTDVFRLLDEDPRNVDQVRSTLVPGSPADRFIVYLHAFDRAVRENSTGLAPSRVRESRLDGIEVCVQRSCIQYSGFVLGDDGILESFDIDGVSIADRFGRPTKEYVFDPLAARVVAAFQRITADQLVVVLELVPSDEAVALALAEAEFHDPSGEATPAALDASAFPAALAAGQHGFVMVQFPDSDYGGELVFTFTTEESDEPVEARIPVDPYESPAE